LGKNSDKIFQGLKMRDQTYCKHPGYKKDTNLLCCAYILNPQPMNLENHRPTLETS